MKSVLISIRPHWCGLIALGKKTNEVRKTRPQIETPIKCFIYCTKNGLPLYLNPKRKDFNDRYLANGKVIGEFVCDGIHTFIEYDGIYYGEGFAVNGTGLTNVEMQQYGQGKDLYGWHISDLVIYDEPREIWEFCRNCNPCYGANCEFCKTHGGSRSKMLQRPPQSWCYVEGV